MSTALALAPFALATLTVALRAEATPRRTALSTAARMVAATEARFTESVRAAALAMRVPLDGCLSLREGALRLEAALALTVVPPRLRWCAQELATALHGCDLERAETVALWVLDPEAVLARVRACRCVACGSRHRVHRDGLCQRCEEDLSSNLTAREESFPWERTADLTDALCHAIEVA